MRSGSKHSLDSKTQPDDYSSPPLSYDRNSFPPSLLSDAPRPYSSSDEQPETRPFTSLPKSHAGRDGTTTVMSPQSLPLANSTLNTLNSTINGQYAQASNNGSDVRLVGSHFTNSLFVAPIVINAICAAGFLILMIYSWVRKMYAKESRKAFLVMMSLLGGMTLSFIRSFADGMVHEYTPIVPPAFLILPALKPAINNTVDITLIGVIYRVIKNRNKALTPPRYGGYNTWQHLHSGAVVLLALLGLADTALYIWGQVLLFTKASVNQRLQEAAERYKDVHLSYTAAYFAVSVEILACAGFLFFKANHQRQHSRITTYLLTLIAPFLVLRSAILLSAVVRFTFETYDESRLFAVVVTALYAFPSLAIFTGLVLVQFCRGWDPKEKEGGNLGAGNVEVVGGGGGGAGGGGGGGWASPGQGALAEWKSPVVRHHQYGF